MSGRLTRLVDRGARFLDDDAGDVFLFAGVPIIGNFAGGDESITLATNGGKEEHFRGVLVVSRLRYPLLNPELMSLITDAAGVRYRIAQRDSDGGSWTLTLSSPNNGRRP